MLNFCNKKIYLDFEIFDSYDIKSLMLCDNPYIATLHPNELHLKSINVSELLTNNIKDIFMTASQLKSFIKEWFNHSNNCICFNTNEWFNDYIQCIKQMSNLMGHYEYTDRNSIFRDRQKWLIENLEIKDEESPIIFDINVEPEYSWKIQDWLENKKINSMSLFSKDIEEIIEINKCKCFEYQNRANIFGQNYLNFKPYNNCETIDDLCYLYFPLSGESINSNFIYIKKCLEKYLEK